MSSGMDRQALAAAAADRLGVPARQVDDVLQAVLTVVAETVAAGGSVTVTGFGSWRRVDGPARVGRNPRTGARVDIPARPGVRFHPSATWLGLVRGELGSLGGRWVTSRRPRSMQRP